MKLSRTQIFEDVEFELERLKCHLSTRMLSLLKELIIQVRDGSNNSNEIDLFEILVRLVFITDKDPASIITNLMVPLDNSGASDLEEWTLSNAGAFLRDFLRKDYTLCILKSEFHERDKSKSKY